MLVPLHLSLLLASILPGGPTCAPPPAPGGDPGYVLHEWGTFTTLSGSNGVLLEGLGYDDHLLPAFVHRRSHLPEGFVGLQLKMETPVIYFYSDRERELRVKVAFPQGVLTQWYPQVKELRPPVGPEALAARGGLLDWGTVRVLAPGDGVGLLPPVGEALHWEHARAVDANVVVGRGLGEHERFLFYRGLGGFGLSVGAWADEDGGLNLSNGGDEPIPGAIVLAREGGRLRAARLDGLPLDRTVRVVLRDLPAVELEELATLTARLLVEQGLYPAEADAMVGTWRESWLESDGLRVLYPLPRAETDWLLPLYVSPPPRESVRVLVGRMDVLTPGMERDALALLPHVRDAADAYAKLGRFALPLARRLVDLADEGRERDHARELVRLLEASF